MVLREVCFLPFGEVNTRERVGAVEGLPCKPATLVNI